jgi:methylphosphotriester-DNA--protein-cysteine methyltransferase
MSQEKKPMKGYVILGVILLLAIIIGVIIIGSHNASGQFVGSKNSDVYHYPSCTYAQRIKDSNKIWFSNSQDARNHGYRPCQVCHPP